MVHRQLVLITLFVVVLSCPPFAVSQTPGGGAAPAVAPGERTNEPVATRSTGPVNINTAGVPELMTLSGVGRTVAEKIVQYREAHGPFKKPEEVRRVRGIGAGLWERNRERIVVK
ncbi:MAG: ComEA family DNA-binding protein [Candidatus Rokuibacteriota bacterium]